MTIDTVTGYSHGIQSRDPIMWISFGSCDFCHYRSSDWIQSLDPVTESNHGNRSQGPVTGSGQQYPVTGSGHRIQSCGPSIHGMQLLDLVTKFCDLVQSRDPVTGSSHGIQSRDPVTGSSHRIQSRYTVTRDVIKYHIVVVVVVVVVAFGRPYHYCTREPKKSEAII